VIPTAWRRRSFEGAGLTQVPPGPYLASLARRWAKTIQVTRAGYDDIGAVLRSMGVSHVAFDGSYDCHLLFMNCGSHDQLDSGKVRSFVQEGGCLYASDLTSDFINATFPGLFIFRGRGSPGSVQAVVIDPDLQAVVGESTTIHFDMDHWAMLQSCRGETLVACAPGSPYGEIPLMVAVGVGDGAVFYTSFHNRAQASEQERVLLQLLVLKQIGTQSNISMAQASQQVGINLSALRARIDN
jgi:hypothetical protein